MDTTCTRVTLKEAAERAGVTTRTVNRWSAAGKLTVERGGWQDPALYCLEEVLLLAGVAVDAEGP